MAAQTRRSASKRRAKSAPVPENRPRSLLIDYLPAWILLGIVLVILLPQIAAFAAHTIRAIPDALGRLFARPSAIAPLFTREIDYWAGDIGRWADTYDVDPNLLATVMQIESCGHPTVSSYAGAQGLFQVMPFHFSSDENQLDPDTNAKRGASFLHQCMEWANGDAGMAMACYNGGPSVLNKSYAYWSDQTRRYYMWGTGIYQDALENSSSSFTLDQWLAAGGRVLCDMASSTLGIR